MSDLIRRQAAIDAVKGRFSMPVDNLIVEVIGALPSAQPTIDAVEVVHCRECKWYVSYTMENKTYKMCRKAHLGSDDFFCADGQKMDGEVKSDG